MSGREQVVTAGVWRRISPSFESTTEAYRWLEDEGSWQLPSPDDDRIGEDV